jgi:hypothetical protein
MMDRDRDKRVLKERLRRCRSLAKDFPDGVTAQHIRELEAALMDELRTLEQHSHGISVQPMLTNNPPHNSVRCSRCDGTGWVCETHILRPREGPKACGCGAAGAPCGRCNNREDGWPRLPEGLNANLETGGSAPTRSLGRRFAPPD